MATGCVGGGGSKRRGRRGGTPRKPTMNTSVYTRIVTSWIVNWNLRKLAAVRESRNILDTQYPFSLCSVWMPSRPLPIMRYSTTLPPPSASPMPVQQTSIFWTSTTRERLLILFYFIFILFIPHEGFNAIKTSFRLRSSRGRNHFFFIILKNGPLLRRNKNLTLGRE